MPLFCLMRLQHARFPLRLERPEDVRRISVLAATGLVEAEFVAPAALRGAYVAPQVVVVTRITEHGLQELKQFVAQGGGTRKARGTAPPQGNA
ncbi:hypothetical protein VLK31_25450 [Variovorax sp. H27-G14]|uniref:hypothetical protein n=1 Tax=Variovorax sp. H27-G14 TaxID=3111914 RepID=UPI0038FC1EC8